MRLLTRLFLSGLATDYDDVLKPSWAASFASTDFESLKDPAGAAKLSLVGSPPAVTPPFLARSSSFLQGASEQPPHARQMNRQRSSLTPQGFPQSRQNNQLAAPTGPIYSTYGSSVVPTAAVWRPQQAMAQASFDPVAMGLSVPEPPAKAVNFAGLYSVSGFDIFSILARVATRPNKTIDVGPIDTSCALTVVDARRPELPIVFASESFTLLTGYSSSEVLGRNCRFLQAPGGRDSDVCAHTDGAAVEHMRWHIRNRADCQASLVNYKKDGTPFVNLVTIIPITWDSADEVAYFVGLQSDLIEQPRAILDRMKEGTYVVNQSLLDASSASQAGTMDAPAVTVQQPTQLFEPHQQQPLSIATADLLMPPPQLAQQPSTHSSLSSSSMSSPEEARPRSMIPIAAHRAQLATPEDDQDAKPSLAARRRSESANAAAQNAAAAARRAHRQPAHGGLNLEATVTLNKPEITSMIDTVMARGIDGLKNDEWRKQFHKLALENARDFVHVLSLKGSFLYCSPSSTSLLGYAPHELVSRTVQTYLHPSDVVPVMRELKEAGTGHHDYLDMTFRIKTKHAGYIWLEGKGKLHVEAGKGRKSVIMIARPRAPVSFSWSHVSNSGALGDTECWAKVDAHKGTVLSCTASVASLLRCQPEDVVGTPIVRLADSPSDAADVEAALRRCCAMTTAGNAHVKSLASTPAAVPVRFHMRRPNEQQSVAVVAHFYPGMLPAGKPYVASVIVQINDVHSESRRRRRALEHEWNGPREPTPAPIEADSDDEMDAPTQQRFTSHYKKIKHPSATAENVFDELDTEKETSWQYELHQRGYLLLALLLSIRCQLTMLHSVQLQNKKLREERDHVLRVTRKSLADFGLHRPQTQVPPSAASVVASTAAHMSLDDAQSMASGSSDRARPAARRSSSSTAGSKRKRSVNDVGEDACANCSRVLGGPGRGERADGPTGPGTLCGGCGIRWLNATRAYQSQAEPIMHPAYMAG